MTNRLNGTKRLQFEGLGDGDAFLNRRLNGVRARCELSRPNGNQVAQLPGPGMNGCGVVQLDGITHVGFVHACALKGGGKRRRNG